MDNELPDYIMVMIANKKPVNSMRNDLQLFLNENTDSFIKWLFEVLKKILPKDTGSYAFESLLLMFIIAFLG